MPASDPRPFDIVLVANRGEIARRIIRTLRSLGIRSVAVYSDGDAGAAHVREADHAEHLGPDPASGSYLRADAVVAAALRSGAQAIHPGYGFLSESVALARACEEAGIVFVGPDIRALEVAGDKARARAHVSAHGVPIVAGFDAVGLDDSDIAARAAEVGFPLLIKPSAGGGGKGMEIVADAAELPGALESARRVARSAFGDDALVLERLISRPRHIEVQLFGDRHGQVVAYGTRECTLQRRHQKVVEEAPAPGVSAQTARRMEEAAVVAARSIDYVGAGTVEFLVDGSCPDEFFFIEMNTRLQVEHPVTEAVTGLDLVALQLHVAAGGHVTPPPPVRGHAIEARVYAESPERGFLPSVGRVLDFRAAPGARTDAAIEAGDDVSPFYDPMIAKVIAHAATRGEALAGLDDALSKTVVLGVETNAGFLRTLCADPRVRAAEMDTGLIDTLLPYEPARPSDAALRAVARARTPQAEEGEGPWRSLRGWRISGTAPEEGQIFLAEDGSLIAAPADVSAEQEPRVTAIAADGAVWVCDHGRSVRLRPLDRAEALRRRLAQSVRGEAARDPECRAPMPGTVVAVHVTNGEAVRAGEPILSIEAMKMEHPVQAPHDGVAEVLVQVGAQVRVEQVVARVPAAETEET